MPGSGVGLGPGERAAVKTPAPGGTVPWYATGESIYENVAALRVTLKSSSLTLRRQGAKPHK